MARNRKRAKERKARRPQPRVTSPVEREVQPGQLDDDPVERLVHDIDELPEDAPDPISHATPDVELAEAQLALGRPDLVGESDSGGAADDEADEADELDEREFEQEEDVADGRSVASTAGGGAVAEHHPRSGNRLINFIQGSWRELQRVQWPDRRQVMQATGVVIGFVIIAGVFLGVADFLAGKLVNFILK